MDFTNCYSAHTVVPVNVVALKGPSKSSSVLGVIALEGDDLVVCLIGHTYPESLSPSKLIPEITVTLTTTVTVTKTVTETVTVTTTVTTVITERTVTVERPVTVTLTTTHN